MKKLLVIDGNNYVFRGNFAQQKKLSYKGQPTKAIHGFFQMLAFDINLVKPTHVLVVYDGPGKNWRKKIYDKYKSNRRIDEMEFKSAAHKKRALEAEALKKEVYSQLPIMRDLLAALNIQMLQFDNTEADDIMASIAIKFSEYGEVVIGTNDKDLAQLVNKKIKILYPDKTIASSREIKKKFGVKPNQIKEYLSLLGDKVDNVPGVPGIGPKTAATLLNEYGSLKKILVAAKSKELTPAITKSLLKHRKEIKIAQQLISLQTDLTLGITLKTLKFPNNPDFKAVKVICDQYGLKVIHNKLKAMIKHA